MHPKNKVRKWEVRTKNNTWIEATTDRLEKGDVVRVTNPDGTPVIDPVTGSSIWQVDRQPSVSLNPLVNQAESKVQ